MTEKQANEILVKWAKVFWRTLLSYPYEGQRYSHTLVGMARVFGDMGCAKAEADAYLLSDIALWYWCKRETAE